MRLIDLLHGDAHGLYRGIALIYNTVTMKNLIRVLCILGGMLASAHVASADAHRRYLAIDPSLHGELQNMNLVMGQAGDPQIAIAHPDDDWERHNNFGIPYVGSIIRDHEGRFRMYYNVITPASWTPGDRVDARQAIAVAFSDDGIHWTKPALNLAPHLLASDTPGAEQSNLIYVEPHPGMKHGQWFTNGHAFYDPDAPKDERYKMAWVQGQHIHTATSADGLRFTNSQHAFRHKADTIHSFFYDSLHGQYVIYGRKRGDWETGGEGVIHRRGVVRHSSANWMDSPWDTVGRLVIDPMDIWDYAQPLRPDVYTPAVQIYHRQYIGLPSVYFQDENRPPVPRPDVRMGTGPIYPLVMHSLDGMDWHFPDRWHPIVPLEPHERVSRYEQASFKGKEVGMLRTAANFLETEDRLLIYYAMWEGTHYEMVPEDRSAIYVASMRLDGFASLHSSKADQPGTWRTTTIGVPQDANAIHINARVTGSLRVEVLDPQTQRPIAGLSRDDCAAFRGDAVRHVMQWTDDSALARVAGRDVQLRFLVDDGEIFSFSFGSVVGRSTISNTAE